MKIKAPDALLAAEVSRRGLMKTTAIGGLAMASSAFTLPFTRIAHAADALAPVNETVTWSACTVNCGSRCPLRMHVVMVKLNTLKRIIPAMTTMMACIRYAPVCAGVPCVAVSTTPIV